METDSISQSGSRGGTDSAPPTLEQSPSRAELLAFDPLSPVVGRTDSSVPDPLALDPLGPIPRFERARC
jgi:hypothetical protein